MTDKEKVLERWPGAVCFKWILSNREIVWHVIKKNGAFTPIGTGTTQADAWHNAAQTITAAEKLN